MIKRSKVDFNKVDKVLPGLGDIFVPYRAKIVAAYLFGSYAAGRVTPLSDIDIAVLLSDDMPEEEYLHLRSELYADLSKFLGTDEIDIIFLNNAPLSMQYGVLKDKKVLYCSDWEKMIDFESRVIKLYLDIKLLRDEFNQEFLKRAGDFIG